MRWGGGGGGVRGVGGGGARHRCQELRPFLTSFTIIVFLSEC